MRARPARARAGHQQPGRGQGARARAAAGGVWRQQPPQRAQGGRLLVRPCRDPRCPGYHHISRCTLTLEGRLPVRPCRYPRRTGSHSASHGGTLNLPYSNQAHPPSRAPPAPRRYSVFQALFANDGNHPSEAGTYLEALVVASTISGAAPKQTLSYPTWRRSWSRPPSRVPPSGAAPRRRALTASRTQHHRRRPAMRRVSSGAVCRLVPPKVRRSACPC